MIDISIDNNIFVQNTLDAAIQELDIMFNTENTELIGYTDYGTNWDQFLWTLTPMVENVKTYIESKIFETYFLSQYDTRVDVEYEHGTERSIYYVKISLFYNDQEISIQQYKLA